MSLMRYILFVPVHGTSVLEMLPVANKVAADRKYHPLFFLFEHAKGTEEYIHQAGLSTIGPYVNGQSNLNQPQLHSAKQSAISVDQRAKWPLAIPNTLLRGLKRYIYQIVPTRLRQVLSDGVNYTRQIREINTLFDREAIVALVLVSDRQIGWETTLVKVANQRRIPSLIMPFALSAPEISARLRLKQYNVDQYYGMKTLSNRIAATLFPHWVYEHKGKRLLFFPGMQSVIAWTQGIMPENPWSIGGGAATRMAVESPRLYHMFVEQAIPEKKLVVTGKPSMDQMYEAMQPANQRIIREELRISETEQVLLCAVPQLAEHLLMSWSQHWQEIEFLLATFAQLENVSVVLSLHPKSNPADYQSLAKRYRAILAKRRIYELLPICDVFVATFSSTVMQTIGLGKPTVIVDFYGLDYTFYDDVSGVIILRSRDQLKNTLARLFSDPQYYGMLAEAQRQHASEWVLLDGKCTNRVVRELYRLIGSKT